MAVIFSPSGFFAAEYPARLSPLGTLVDGKMVGGTKQTGRLELRTGDHEVRLGGALTPFRLSLNVAGAKKNGHHPRRRRA